MHVDPNVRYQSSPASVRLFDPKSGLATMLMKFDPGAVLPDHEHVQIEQTYVISGKLVDKEARPRA